MHLVSGNIRLMWIFAGISLGGVVKHNWVVHNDNFQHFRWSYFFENCRHNASIIIWRYAIPWWLVIDCKMNDLEWPWVRVNVNLGFRPSTFRLGGSHGVRMRLRPIVGGNNQAHYFSIAFLPRDALVYSAVLRLHVVRPSVCNVGGSGSHRLEILETNCTFN